MSLNDREIRSALLERLASLPYQPKALLEEVRVHNGNAIADVVTVHSKLHCYEIKGESDVLRRILKQGSYYDQAFHKITLVTTENHLKIARSLAPPHWGLMVATTNKTKKISLRYERGATDSPWHNKQIALLTLWRDELVSGLKDSSILKKKPSRQMLSDILAKNINSDDLDLFIGEKLIGRLSEKRLR